MTAQPEVVWVYQGGEGIAASVTELITGIPYVPQSALTAALAERDKLAKELDEVRMELNRLSAKSNHD